MSLEPVRRRPLSVSAFIRRNRALIDDVARSGGHSGRLNDDDREQWIANDECLYRLAQRAGCAI